MRIKRGVIMAGLQLPMRKVLIKAEEVWSSHGQELVVTSALDGEHSAGSLHYYGYALDLRTRYFDLATKEWARHDLQMSLGNAYKVIKEPTHIHVECIIE